MNRRKKNSKQLYKANGLPIYHNPPPPAPPLMTLSELIKSKAKKLSSRIEVVVTIKQEEV